MSGLRPPAVLDGVQDLLQALVRCRTVAGRDAEMWRAFHLLRLWWQEALPRDVASATFTSWGNEDDGLPLVFLHPPGDAAPPLLLHAHLDVVEGDDDAFRPRREGERLHGRGACDMKGAAVAMLHLAAELLPRGTGLGVLYTWNEELGGRAGSGRGTETFLRSLCGYRPRFFLSGERSDLRIAWRSKGLMKLAVTVKGQAAHAATPWEGDSALARVAAGIAALGPPGDPEGTTLVPTTLSAGSAANVVPDLAILGIDARPTDAEESARVRARVAEAFPGALVEALLDEPGAACPADDPCLAALEAALREAGVAPVRFTKPHASDVRLANEAGIPGVVFGPTGDRVHAVDEWLSLPSLETYRDVLGRFVRAVAAQEA